MVKKIQSLKKPSLLCGFLLLHTSEYSASQYRNSIQEVAERKQLCDSADQLAEKIREKIDHDILNIDTQAYFRSIAGSYYTVQKMRSLHNESDLINELQKIVPYIEEQRKENANQDLMLLEALMKKHHLFRSIIGRLADAKAMALKSSNGKNLDELYNNMTGQLSPIPCYLKFFIHQKALNQYVMERKLIDPIAKLPFDKKENEIHYMLLCGHKNISLYSNQLLISSDNKYLRACSPDGSKMFWNMRKGLPEKSVEESSFAWQRYDEDNDHCRAQRVISPDGNYLATPGMAIAFGSNGMHNIIYNNVDRKKIPFPVLVLFVRPTIESSLCLEAFLNSKGNRAALEALKASEIIKKVDGFPAYNLNALIEKELSGILEAKL